jgi:hypothetical protein
LTVKFYILPKGAVRSTKARDGFRILLIKAPALITIGGVGNKRVWQMGVENTLLA